MRTQTQVQKPMKWVVAQEYTPDSAQQLVEYVSTPPALNRRARTVARVTQQVGMRCPCFGPEPMFAETRYYQLTETDWLLMPLAQHPAYGDRDGFPMPRETIDRLNRIRGQVEFDALYIGQEVPKGVVQPGRPVDDKWLLPPPGRETYEMSEQLGQLTQQGWRVATSPITAAPKILGGLAKVGAAVAVGAAAVAGVAMAAALPMGVLALAALDPILFGAVVAPGRPVAAGEMAMWFVLAEWDHAKQYED